jgi:hypothetical protein
MFDFGEVYNLTMDRLDGGGSRCGWQCAFTNGGISDLRAVTNVEGAIWGYLGSEVA